MIIRRLLILFVLTVVLLLVVFAAVLLGRARWMPSHQLAVVPDATQPFKPGRMVSRIQTALQYKTVAGNTREMKKFRRHLRNKFPRMHRALKLEMVAGNTMLYRWQGANKKARPLLWLANYDVVSASEKQAAWEKPPFAGEVDETYLWGRGALDGKVLTMVMCESVEQLLREKFKPQRTMYFAFTHDGESGGLKGAAAVAALLKKRKQSFEYVMAPGGAIGKGLVPDATQPVALVGVAEKGFLSLRLSVSDPGGPSSIPSKRSSISVLGQAVKRLEERPFPPRLTATLKNMHAYVAESIPVADRVALANLWLLEPLILRRLADSASGSSQVRTTTAVTMVRSGTQDTMLAQSAEAVVNFRMLPGDTKETVLTFVASTIADPAVGIEQYGKVFAEPSAASSIQSPAFYAIQRAFRQTYDNTIVAPYMLSGMSDGRHFADIADNVYRVTPLHFAADDMRRIHGVNERVRIADLSLAAAFYMRLLKASQ